MTQQLARRWVGDAVRFRAQPGHEWELGWFNDGVARYVATLLLARLGLLPAKDWREAVAGELSVLATSPYAAKGNAELAALAPKDPVARATMMARGALYAMRESAVLEAKTKGERRLENVLVDLRKQAANEKDDSTAALPESAWLETLSKDDPDAAKSFDAIVTKGGPVTLPADALGPCFRAGTGEYAAFDPGFDLEATRIEKDGKVVGVRADGPAAKAGLKDGDVLESMSAREDDASVPVKIVVTRAGRAEGERDVRAAGSARARADVDAGEGGGGREVRGAAVEGSGGRSSGLSLGGGIGGRVGAREREPPTRVVPSGQPPPH